MATKKGLGRGLDILIPKDNGMKKQAEKQPNSKIESDKKSTGKRNTGRSQKTKEETDQEILININKIEPNREQPRKQFDEEGIEELADSIKQYGLIQPLIVQKKDKYYEIIAGERRWRACKKAGIKEVPVIIKEYDDKDTLKISLVENIQRENLNPIEEAQAYQVLAEDHGMTQEQIAASVSKSRTAVANIMRLLKLDARIQNLIMENQITYGHGRALLGIEDKEEQYKTALIIRDNNLSVRESEKLIKKILDEKQEEKKPEDTNDKDTTMVQFFEERLHEIFGSKVVIKNRKNNNGKIEINFHSKEELERIIDLLQSIK